MYCDQCGAKLKTVTTMPYDGYKQIVVRYKKCFNCGRRYRTIEVKEKDGETWLVRKQRKEET